MVFKERIIANASFSSFFIHEDIKEGELRVRAVLESWLGNGEVTEKKKVIELKKGVCWRAADERRGSWARKRRH